MSDTELKTEATAIVMIGYLYSKKGPIQSIPLRVKREGTGETSGDTVTITVDLKPGKPCQLPKDHAVTVGLLARKLIVPISEETASPAEESVKLADLATHDTRRVAAIEAAIPDLSDTETTQAGKPRIDALETRLGFKPTSGEIETALASLNLEKDA